MRSHYSSSFLVVLILVASPTLADTLRVPDEFPTIQQAIDASVDGDTVLVGAGIYVETIDFVGKTIVVRSLDGPESTVIDANQAGSVATFQKSETPLAILEGFTLTNGIGTKIAQSTYGGGIFCTFSSPTVRKCIIAANTAHFGGGVACFARGNAVLEDNVIRDNVATEGEDSPFGSGGGVFTTDESHPTLRRNVILRNASDYRGGGIASSFQSDPLLEDNVIEDNRAELEGGGIAFWATPGPILFGNTVSGNFGGVRGGGLFATDSAPVIVGGQFEGNVCDGNGGAISCYNIADAWIESNRITGNTAGLGGAGIHCDLSNPTLLNNVIDHNVALCLGEACGGGGFLCKTDSQPILTNNTFYGNTSTKMGGAMHVLVYSHPVVTNSILWNNPGEDGEEITTLLAGVTLSHSIVKGGWPGAGVMDVDPGFVDAEAGDLHLRLGSPAVDAGANGAASLPSTDFEGDPRIVSGGMGVPAIVDIGADEMLPEIAVRYGTVNAAGDYLSSVLTVSGSAGDRRREVVIPILTWTSVTMTAPPAGPASAPYVLYAWEGESDPTTLVPQPFGLGTMSFGTPLQPELPQPFEIWNNLGHARKLGERTLPSIPAPSLVIEKFARFRTVVTVQGFILDDGSAADGPASITNAVVIRVME